jgi:hypothetical protein
MVSSSDGIKMREYIKLFYPDIYLSYTKVNCWYSKTGIDFIDKDYWSGLSLE